MAALAALTAREAEEALGRGEVDCAFLLASYDDSPTVQHLLADEKVGLLGFPHADAHVALNPSLRKVTLPMGVGNLAANRPPSDLTMVALTTSLVVRDDLHTALQFLLLEAAQEIHSRAGIFRRAGQFPAAEEADLPISAAARSFYKAGPSFIQRHLPFWLWALASRLLLVVVPLAAVAYPLARLLPAAYGWMMQQRIVKLYGELRLLERHHVGCWVLFLHVNHCTDLARSRRNDADRGRRFRQRGRYRPCFHPLWADRKKGVII